jgi:hypothetical protein
LDLDIGLSILATSTFSVLKFFHIECSGGEKWAVLFGHILLFSGYLALMCGEKKT